MSATPSPWEVYDGHNRDAHWHRHACVWSTSAGHLVAYTDFMTAEMAVANARLIAAAPDMLAALKELLRNSCEQDDCTAADYRAAAAKAEAAIIKAEGHTP